MRVYIEGYGCAQNLGEAESLRELARAHGHVVAEAPQGADVGVLVTCAVIGTTEDHMVERWKELSSSLPHTIVTGCMVPLRSSRLTDKGPRGETHCLPTRAQESLPGLLERLRTVLPEGLAPIPRTSPLAGADHPTTLVQLEGAPPPETSPTVHRELVLSQGCTSHCTYCFSRLARGPLQSRSLETLREQARRALAQGAVELRLSSLDTSCWGEDLGPKGPRLPELVAALGSLPSKQEYRLRVGMMSPQSFGRIAEGHLAALREAPRLFRFLHLPVQSGSDRVLEGMRRGYTVEEFRRDVSRAREAAPDLTLSTDVIVGFPGEEPSDHEATLRLLEELQPEILNVTRFSPRPHTPAARLRPVVGRVVKERSREIASLRLRLARTRMERWVGWEGEAVVTEHGPKGTAVARLPNYLPVVLPERLALRTWTTVRVNGARSTYLLGVDQGPREEGR